MAFIRFRKICFIMDGKQIWFWRWNFVAARRYVQWARQRNPHVYWRFSFHGVSILSSNVPLTLRQLYSL